MSTISSDLQQRFQFLTDNSRFSGLFPSTQSRPDSNQDSGGRPSSLGVFNFTTGSGLTPQRPTQLPGATTSPGANTSSSIFNFGSGTGSPLTFGSIPAPTRPAPPSAPPLVPSTPAGPQAGASPTTGATQPSTPQAGPGLIDQLPPEEPINFEIPTAPTPTQPSTPQAGPGLIDQLPPEEPINFEIPTAPAPTAPSTPQAGPGLIDQLPPEEPINFEVPVATPPENVDLPIAPPAASNPNSTTNTLRADPDYEAFVTALDATGQSDFIDAQGEVMVLAPTDDAFRRLATNTLGLNTDGLSDADVGSLVVNTVGLPAATELVRYHISPEARTFQDLITRDDNSPTDSFAQARITPFAGAPIDVNGGMFSDADPDETDAAFTGRTPDFGVDIQTSNGIIHGVDRVLLPNDIDGLGIETDTARPIFLNPVF